MACHIKSRNSHCHQSSSRIRNCDGHHYSDVPPLSDDLEIEPEAPTLSLGNRILWLTESRAASGIVKWIGRIPSISSNWTAGVEFDNVMPGGGNGDFRGRQFFTSRTGHALFLPVTDLIKVDSDSTANSNERTSFFGRLQDSCSNFAHRRRRDATFGHFKQDFCSNCVRNDFSNYSHYCHNVPVYDRISTRRSVHFDDHSYEMYNPHVPCGFTPNTSNRFHRNKTPNREVEEDHQQSSVVDRRIPVLQSMDRMAEDYSNNSCPRISMLKMRRDSIFNYRPNINFISSLHGIKEWVTCLVLGTNRRKGKSKIIFKDKKTVTNVLITQSGQSLTGQRLSSFADYATVTVNRAGKENCALTENANIKDNDDENGNIQEVIDDVKENNLRHNHAEENVHHMNDKATETNKKRLTVQHSTQTKVKRKKRPAPLPPTHYSRMSSNSNKTNEIASTSSKGTNTVRSKDRETRYKVVRSNSFRIHTTTPKKHRRKKRQAPPPPSPMKKAGGIDKSVSTVSALNSFPGSSKNDMKEKQSYQKVALDEQNISLPKPKLKKARQKIIHKHVRHGAYVNGYSDSGEESGSEDSKNSTNSLSFSEDESDDEKYGLVKYGLVNKMSRSETSLNFPSTSTNYVQYAGENSDVCLKISIQKTETNVVTVEEVSTPCYTIEEDSSSSDLSDVPIEKEAEKKSINLADSSSVSTVEENDDKSKTIFQELQMKPPVKGSVKDFVNAFNMLATKNYAIPESKRLTNGNLSVPMIQNNLTEPQDIKIKQKDLQSIPTKWEYQNKTSSLGYNINKHLLPIAEESHNETSEHDGNISPDEPLSASVEVKNVKIVNRNACTSKMSENDHNLSNKCSHCSETHAQANNVSTKSLKKRIAPPMDNIVYETVKPFKNNFSSQSTMTALSSLLQNNPSSPLKNGNLEKLKNSGKNCTKLDQPIMVGLYIEDKSSHRGPIPLLVTPSMSLRKLKRQIEKEYEFPRHQQCWILGESFAVADEASLSSYGVVEPGCPVLLYVMSKDSKSNSLPPRTSSRFRANPSQDINDSSEEETEMKSRSPKKSFLKSVSTEANDVKKEASLLGAIPKSEKSRQTITKVPPRIGSRKRNDAKSKKSKSEFHKAWEAEFERKTDYHNLLALDDVDLVLSVEKFECPVCFLDVDVGEGATLQECLHSFCKECLAGAILFSETAVVKCPFRNDEYSCESHLQEREVKSLVTPDVYEKHLQRSMALAESQAQNSFHCKTPDCPGWCLFEDAVNIFLCPVCKHTNCLTCAAIHEGKNCRQFQDDVSFNCDSSEEARKTKEYLQNMVDNGEAMRCPQCQVILMKKWGCDWLKCSMCHTEVCWVTKGPRWGPGGRGDTSGGCKCMLNGARCHPKCSYCH